MGIHTGKLCRRFTPPPSLSALLTPSEKGEGRKEGRRRIFLGNGDIDDILMIILSHPAYDRPLSGRQPRPSVHSMGSNDDMPEGGVGGIIRRIMRQKNELKTDNGRQLETGR